jgi:hypothetical protein
MTPVETIHHQWAIVSSGEVVAIGLGSHAAAWAWIDARDSEHAEMIERHYRIRMAFSPAND